MRKVEIRLFSFDELSKEVKVQVLTNHTFAMVEMYKKKEEDEAARQKFERELSVLEVHQDILVNNYLFFLDGTLAETVSTVDDETQVIKVELTLGGENYIINKPAPVSEITFENVIKRCRLKTFASDYSKEDTELPYQFELHWNLKSVGQLDYSLKTKLFKNVTHADIINMMSLYKLFPNNLAKYYKPKS